MKFVKMHASGNDFVVINTFEEQSNFEPNRLAELICDRHFGIGADGLLFVEPSEVADFKMSLYNSDGSKGETCANAIRCLAKYVYDTHMTNMTVLTVETAVGIREVVLTVKDEKVKLASVNFGIPILRSHGAEMPLIPKEGGYAKEVITEMLAIGSDNVRIAAVELGVPQAVVFVKDIDEFPYKRLGPAIESHNRFPEKTNVAFAQRVDDGHLKVRVWERGNGETMSCGTGAAAAVIAASALGFVGNEADVRLPGGSLQISIAEDGQVTITGQAMQTFEGEIDF